MDFTHLLTFLGPPALSALDAPCRHAMARFLLSCLLVFVSAQTVSSTDRTLTYSQVIFFTAEPRGFVISLQVSGYAGRFGYVRLYAQRAELFFQFYFISLGPKLLTFYFPIFPDI